MTAKNRETRAVRRSEAPKALAKAEEFLAAGEASLGSGRWNAAGLDSVHSGIAAADAALIAICGMKSVAEGHGAIIRILESRVPSFEAAQRRQLLGLLKMKHEIAYEQRPVTETEARQLVDHARRLVRWARPTVGGST